MTSTDFETLIDIQSLKLRLDDPRLAIVDCRFDLANPDWGQGEYLLAHIRGAQYAHLDDDLSGPPVTNRGRHPMPTHAAMNGLFARLAVDVTKQVVVYDSSGGAICARLWWMLRHMGHPRVAVLDGGWQSWTESGLPVVAGLRDIPATRFSGESFSDRLALLEEVGDAPLLIDAREPPRYRGEVEPLDPVAGHIPGAINHFWKQNLQEDGTFKDPSSLRARFNELLADIPAAEALCYCGSGVTACHNVLAMVHAGLEEPRLYGGSWSEMVCGFGSASRHG